jgi:radical SAM protein with 4Fe4S-binding SPASM domain
MIIPPKKTIWKECTYIAAFLTMKCPLKCSYCINNHSQTFSRNSFEEIEPEQWINFINNLDNPNDTPITLQGGEPTSYKGFYDILSNINPSIKLDLLTNLTFDIRKFCSLIKPERFYRDDVIYTPIRISFHPEEMDIEETITKTKILIDNGFQVGIFVVDHPSNAKIIREMHYRCLQERIYFWIKDFLGVYDNKLFGIYKNTDAIGKNEGKKVQCRTRELLISPNGNIYKCHSDLYENVNPIDNIENNKIQLKYCFRECNRYGLCNPCDLKIKTNRFFAGNFTAVDILKNF